MTRDGDRLVLVSGRQFYAHSGILGLSDKLVITEGYDGGVREDRRHDADVDVDEDEDKPFTVEERAEIAAYMVGLWQQWAAK